MDLFDVIRACIRRWYVTVPLAVITLWYAHQTYSAVKPVFYSNTIIGISAPNYQVPWSSNAEPIPQNGLLATGGPALLAQMLVFGLNDPNVINKVIAGGGKPNYNVRLFQTGGDLQSSSLPLVMIESTQPDPESAKKTVELVSANADPVFRQIQQQAGVPDSMMARTLVASPAIRAQAATPSRTKTTFAMLSAGLGATVLAAVLVDSLILRRRIPRPSEAKPTIDPGDSRATLSTERPPGRVDREIASGK